MAAHQTSLTKAMSLDDLDDYLMSDSSPAESMLLSDLGSGLVKSKPEDNGSGDAYC